MKREKEKEINKKNNGMAFLNSFFKKREGTRKKKK